MNYFFLKQKKTSYLLLLFIFGLLLYITRSIFILSETGKQDYKVPSPTNLPEVKAVRDQISPVISVLDQKEEIDSIPKVFASVVKVVDGDTIEVDFGSGDIKTVRYIGIDTPETVDPRKPAQCFGREASDKNKELVLGRYVGLEKDVSETDKYGRLLRYVYVNDAMVNKMLVEEGYAKGSSYPPDIKHQDTFRAAEAVAREGNKGLWGVCSSTELIPQKTYINTSDNDKDCSDFGTHQEAQNYFESKGGSPVNNVDKLDGFDRDGKVCETLP